MKSEPNQISDTILEVTFTLEKAEVQKERERFARSISAKRPIPGFRPGHAPVSIVASQYGTSEFEREVATTLIRETIINYLVANTVNPIIDPSIELKNFDEELSFKATFTTRPTVTVGNYKGIKAKKPKAKEVKKDEVEKIIKNLHEKSNTSNTNVDPETGEKFIVDAQGQRINLGKSKQGPLDDEFAKQFGMQTLDELKERIKNNLISENERQAEVDFETNLLEELVKITKVTLPQTLVDVEVNAMINRLESQVVNLGGNFEDYLKEQKKSREDVRKDFEKNARKTLTASLALDEIAKDNTLTVSSEEVEAAISPEHRDHEGERESIRVTLLRREALTLLKREVTQK